MKQFFFGFHLLAILWASTTIAQITRFPATIQLQVVPPYSVFLSDYTDPINGRLQANITFNDFNEPQWQVKFRLSIESNTLRLRTKASFIPSPTTILPGVPVPLTGADLAEYFRYENLDISGISPAELARNNRLPEGFYTFCVEALDYTTGTVLSNRACAVAILSLQNPPRPITPMCGGYIKPQDPLYIPFQWQAFGGASANGSQTEYFLHLFELTDPSVNPVTALLSGKTLPIYQSQPSTQPSLLYDITAPPLEIGKTYIYQIQARDPDGRDAFKNNGLSEVCWFYYGYPTGGNITLQTPLDLATFNKQERPYFSWSAPSKLLNGQSFEYVLKIDHTNLSAEAPNAGMENLEFRFPTTYSKTGFNYSLDTPLLPMGQYQWNVQAFSDGQLVAESPTRSFTGPPLIEKFYAGRHEVSVRSSQGTLDNLSGTALVQVARDSTITVKFNSLNIKKSGQIYVLESGEINHVFEPTQGAITLTPVEQQNGLGYFYPSALQLNKQRLSLTGVVKWPLPHATDASDKAMVVSKAATYNYDDFTLLGITNLAENNQFTLLEPYGYQLDIDSRSVIYVTKNTFKIDFKGRINTPKSTQNSSVLGGPFLWQSTSHLFYFKGLKEKVASPIKPIPAVNMYIDPTEYTIDLSNVLSPGLLQADASWKGIYLDQFALQYKKIWDAEKQVILCKEFTKNYTLQNGKASKAWLGTGGLTFELNDLFARGDSAWFNRFPSQLGNIAIDIRSSQVQTGEVTGQLVIPFISNTRAFQYTLPIDQDGMRPGYMNDLDGHVFTFNPQGGEQAVEVTIKRPFFENRDRLALTLDLDWKGLGYTFTNLDGFKAFGNYAIGFNTPNGAYSLPQQLSGTLSGYPVVIDHIGAGSSDGAYAFGLSAKIQMGEDISGDNGAPITNVYSTVANDKLGTLLAKEKEQQALASQILKGETPSKPMEITPEALDNAEKAVKETFKEAQKIEMTSELAAYEGPSTKDIINLPNSTIQFEAITVGNTTTVNVSWKQIIGLLKLAKPYLNLKEGEDQAFDVLSKILEEIENKELKSKLDSFKSENYLINFALNKLADTLFSSTFKTIDANVLKVNKGITTQINNGVVKCYPAMNKAVDVLFNSFSTKLASYAKVGEVDMTKEALDILNKIRDTTKVELQRSFMRSVTANITTPITGFIKNDIADSTKQFLRKQVVKSGFALVKGEFGETVSFETIAGDATKLFEGMGNKAKEKAELNKILFTLEKTALGTVKGIDFTKILVSVQDELLTTALKLVATKAATKLLTNLSENSNLAALASNVADNVKFDFKNLGSNLKEGKIDKIIKFDPTKITVKTKQADFTGMVKMIKDDPLWGDSWQAMLSATIKITPTFNVNAKYINGRKEDFGYWFLELGVKNLAIPIGTTGISFDGATGRVFHHMRKTGLESVPDKTINAGVGLMAYFIDTPARGGTFKFDVGMEVQFMDKGMIAELNGNVAMINTPMGSLVTGTGFMRFNTIEKEFLGNFDVQYKQIPFVCARGNFNIFVNPNDWQLSVGTPQSPNWCRLFCLPALQVDQWLVINKKGMDLGVRIDQDFSIKSPEIGIESVGAVQFGADAGLFFEALAVVDFSPLKIRRAKVELEAYTSVYANYKVFYPCLFCKDFSCSIRTCESRDKLTFVGARLYGLVELDTEDDVRVQGKLSGNLTVLNIGVGFDLGVDKKLK